MSLTVGQIVFKALQKIGMRNRRDFVPRDEMQDGIEALWLMLDSWSKMEKLLIPYETQRDFAIYASKRQYTYGPGGDFDAPVPVEIKAAWMRDSAGADYPIEFIDANLYATGNLQKETSYGRPYTARWVPSWPASQVQFDIYPLQTDRFHVITLEPFVTEDLDSYGCCSDVEQFECGCAPECQEDACDNLNYTVTGPDNCSKECRENVLAQAEADVANGTIDCCCETTQDYTYSPQGEPEVTCTVNIKPGVRTAMKPFVPALNERVEFPTGYQELLIWCLAARLASEYNLPDVPPAVEKQATRMLKAMKASQNRTPILGVDEAITWPGRRYSVWSGPRQGGGRY